MSGPALSHNLLAWMLQTCVIALVAAALPIVFRVRQPRIQLLYCHAVLALCLLLPLLQPWRSPVPGSTLFAPHGRWVFGILATGIALQLCWMSGGLWRIRRYRIAATPLYPIPEAMRAASALTQADALFCVSGDATGPVMLGWLAPVVLLPASFLALDEEAQCGIACHELLHVRRGDWLVALIEEFSGALLWFNPGVWLLLSAARLAREQLVDAESVRLTDSPEPYIDALLSIARRHAGSDLVPAPSFLRRSHLTQRMQALLSDAPASAPRLIGSYCSIAAVLACSIWFACSSFPLLLGQPRELMGQPSPSQPSAPAAHEPPVVASNPSPALTPASVPRLRPAESLPEPAIGDPYEPVGPGTQVVATPVERSSALSLLAGARQRALRHAPGTHPYRFTASFLAAGNALDTGSGELTETWMTGQRWRWTASLGNFSHAQLLYRGQLFEDPHVAVIPMRAHMLRNEIFWATRGPVLGAWFRVARVLWQGKPARCILESEGTEVAIESQGRRWDEEEYCLDDASGALLVHSIAPGTYAQFDYGAGLQFHGLDVPGRIAIYVAGALAADASFIITDATSADEDVLAPTPEMTALPRPFRLGAAFHSRVDAPAAMPANAVRPVIVHAEIDGEGNVVETELSAAADAALFPAALERIKKMEFGRTGTERHVYIDVRFVPASQ